MAQNGESSSPWEQLSVLFWAYVIEKKLELKKSSQHTNPVQPRREKKPYKQGCVCLWMSDGKG